MSVGVRENDNREDIRAILINSLFCITDATFAGIAEKTLFFSAMIGTICISRIKQQRVQKIG